LNIQDGINEAKKEFSSDEQMLASAFKLEKFYKKHKIKIFTVIGAAVLFFGGRAIMGMVEEHRLNSANDAYLTLQKDANNQEALATLKSENPALFELYSYKQAVDNKNIEALKQLSSSKNTLIADIAKYHLLVIEGKRVDSSLYAEMAMVDNAYLAIKEGKMQEAKDELSQIDERSPLYSVAQLLKHYTIKGH
jgi:hypothetical protein